MHYVIGDVHGCLDDLLQLLSVIDGRDKRARYIFVGDFIDRGPRVWDTLLWAREHITPAGKYRSVRGNHEEMAAEWFFHYRRWYEYSNRDYRPPRTRYDFSDVLDARGVTDPADIEPFIDFMRSLPLRITVRVKTPAGKSVLYDIVHANLRCSWLNTDEETLLWDRCASYTGNQANRRILVHGHTPTITRHELRDGIVPGRITYRHSSVNVDGGGVFFPYGGYPCSLCALCLETLDEFYPYTITERLAQAGLPPGDWEDIHEQYLRTDPDRRAMLKRLGLT